MVYLALLRGINVGGNNKVAMKDLKVCLEDLGFSNVSTYINSGNVFFEANPTDEAELVKRCEEAIEQTFGFKVVVMVISKPKFIEAMKHMPSWWGNSENKAIRSDAIFVIPPTTSDQVLSEIKIKPGGPDQFAHSGQMIFWSLERKNYTKSALPKIIGTPIYKQVTLRSSTTTNKLLALMENL